jgi:hypothetical protein
MYSDLLRGDSLSLFPNGLVKKNLSIRRGVGNGGGCDQ